MTVYAVPRPCFFTFKYYVIGGVYDPYLIRLDGHRNMGPTPKQLQVRTMSPGVTYVYRTAANKVAFFKDRFIPKRFKYREPNGTTAKAYDLPKLLYRLPELLGAKRNAQV